MASTKNNLSEEQSKLSKELTSLQRKFVINLVSGMTQRQAYLDAGGKAKSTSAQDAAASTMLSNVKVRAFYDSLMEESKTGAVMTKAQAMELLSVKASVTVKDVCDFKNVKVGDDEDGNPVYQTVWSFKDSEDIPDHIAACIKSVAVTREGPKIELYDSNASAKQLGDWLGWGLPAKPTVPVVKFDFKADATPSEQAAQIINEAAKGKIAPDVAQMFISSISSMMKIEEVTEIADRLEEIEKMMGVTGG